MTSIFSETKNLMPVNFWNRVFRTDKITKLSTFNFNLGFLKISSRWILVLKIVSFQKVKINSNKILKLCFSCFVFRFLTFSFDFWLLTFEISLSSFVFFRLPKCRSSQIANFESQINLGSRPSGVSKRGYRGLFLFFHDSSADGERRKVFWIQET